MKQNAISKRIQEAAIQEMPCDSTGLSEEQAIKNKQRYGSNKLTERSRVSFLHCFSRAFINPFSTILFVLALISFLTEIITKDTGSLRSVVIILTMLVISGCIRLVQELRSKHIADGLTRLVHTTVTVLRSSQWQEVSSEDIVVGDVVCLKAGDRVPADIRLLEAEDLFVSQSVITGETAILEKTEAPLSRIPANISDYHNTVFMGTTVTGGKGHGVVLAVGQETVYGNFEPATLDRKRGFDRGANAIAWVLIRFIAVLVPVVFLLSGVMHGDWLSAFLFALSVAVGLTPEMLPMVISACLAKGSSGMGKKQTVMKDINAMQGFGSMDILCVDKTGTLTGDTILLEYYMDILGNESQKVLDYGYLGSCYHTGVQNHLDTAISKVSTMPGREDHFQKLLQNHPKLDERPFDYSRRFGSVLVGGEENILIVKGSIDEVVSRCSHAEFRGERVSMGADAAQQVHMVVDEMLADGMKVLAVACKTLHKDSLGTEDEQELTLLGYLAFFDAPKKSAASAIEKLRQRNVSIRVLTGDQMGVALSICRRLNIPTEHVMTGAELAKISDNDLPVAVEHTNIFAELSPRQKAMIVEILQTNGHCVGFLGDGLNDLPAVIQADVGISVENAAEAVKESADVILLKKDLNVLEEGILEGRRAFANMTKYMKITASSNFAKLTPDQKARVVSVLRASGHTVGFMGDGINDAAAMKCADVGISVDTAVDVAKESADIILLEKDLMVLEEGIVEGRKTYANMIKYIKMTASSNFGNMFSVLAASALLPFLPMMSVHLIFLNLIYDLSCTAIPWDNVDEEFLKIPRKWDASSVGNFMIWIGPTSSIFDFTTYIFMYFVFCPLFVSNGVLYNDLAAHFSGAELASMQTAYIAMFQAGWFVESMWSQTLVIHMIRTPKVPFIQSRASAPVTLLTFTGIALLTIIPFTAFGRMLGFVALPMSYFAYLIPCILLYMILATSLKKAYVRHYGELL